eukprot:2142900-Pyramimonas_sp.AAC.1
MTWLGGPCPAKPWCCPPPRAGVLSLGPARVPLMQGQVAPRLALSRSPGTLRSGQFCGMPQPP